MDALEDVELLVENTTAVKLVKDLTPDEGVEDEGVLDLLDLLSKALAN